MMAPPFTATQIDALPTILDVVEQISEMENTIALKDIYSIPPEQYHDEGRFNLVSDSTNRSIVRLMPTSQTPFVFFRGQSTYYPHCFPTLYRPDTKGNMPTEDDIAYNRIFICEFARLLDTHPVLLEVSRNTYINPVALAQHYGLATEYLDLTNSKWVAAFFASTGYDYQTDTYYPVGRDYKDGFGVMYISKTLDSFEHVDKFFEKNDVFGYQYFARPTKQSSFGFKMSIGEDFNASPFFDKIFFRHDFEASAIVFNMSYRQKRFIPNDTLSKMARSLTSSKEVTRKALFLCWSAYYQDKSPVYLDEVCRAKGLTIREDDTPVVSFPEEELKSDWKEWNEFGREDLKSRILPLKMVTTVRF